jgi:hypothetical protein
LTRLLSPAPTLVAVLPAAVRHPQVLRRLRHGMAQAVVSADQPLSAELVHGRVRARRGLRDHPAEPEEAREGRVEVRDVAQAYARVRTASRRRGVRRGVRRVIHVSARTRNPAFSWAFVDAGGGTRTPDTRIMIPLL